MHAYTTPPSAMQCDPSQRLPNPYEEAERRRMSSLPQPQSGAQRSSSDSYRNQINPPQQETRSEDAAYQAALEASRSSAAEEALQRQRREEEEMRRLEALHAEEERKRHEETQRREQEELRRVMEESMREQAMHRSRMDEERRIAQRAVDESRVAEERRRREEEEELKRAMETSLREEWDRRSQMEEQDRIALERAREEIAREQRLREERGIGSSSRASPAPAQGARRPLPEIPPIPPRRSSVTDVDEGEGQDSSQHASPEQGPHDGEEQGEANPFADAAEAPPAYDSVGTDRPPDAPSRAPTAIWDAARAERIREQRSQAAATPQLDAMEEKRRMERAGMAQQAALLEVSQPSRLVVANHTSTDNTPGTSRAPSRMASQARFLPQEVQPPVPREHSASAGSTESPSSSMHDTIVNGTSNDVSPISTPATEVDRSSPASADSGQTAPLGIDWGYSDVAFDTRLRSQPTKDKVEESGAPDLKTFFPKTISLATHEDPLGGTFFTLRCGSWKLLLRALAWLGNTQIENGDEDAASASPGLLRVQIEFVTPQQTTQDGYHKSQPSTSSLDLQSPSFATHRHGDQVTQDLADVVRRHGSSYVACASICLSLVPSDNQSSLSAAGETANASYGAASQQRQRRAERDLDMAYLKHGSSRKVISLSPSPTMGAVLGAPGGLRSRLSSLAGSNSNSGSLELPLSLIKLAQVLREAHRLSASCPSSGSAARHSPRQLYHSIEAHDEKFVQRVVVRRMAAKWKDLKAEAEDLRRKANDEQYEAAGEEIQTRLIAMALATVVHSGHDAAGSSLAAPTSPLLLLDLASVLGEGGKNSGPTTTRPHVWGPLFPTGLSGSSSSPAATGRTSAEMSTDGRGSALAQDEGAGVHADNLFGAEERSSHLGRMKDRVKRKWKARAGDLGGASGGGGSIDGEDDDLANWITPLDLRVDDGAGGGGDQGPGRSDR